MNRFLSILFLLLILLFLAACDIPRIALIPETHGNIMQGKISANGLFTIANEEGNLTCSGRYKVTENSLTCEGKEGIINFTCSDGNVIKAIGKSTSCDSVEGEAYDSTGAKYNVYIEKKELIEKRITEYKLKKE